MIQFAKQESDIILKMRGMKIDRVKSNYKCVPKKTANAEKKKLVAQEEQGE